MTISCFKYSKSPERVMYLHAGEEESKISLSGFSFSEGSWSEAIPRLEKVLLLAVILLRGVLD